MNNQERVLPLLSNVLKKWDRHLTIPVLREVYIARLGASPIFQRPVTRWPIGFALLCAISAAAMTCTTTSHAQRGQFDRREVDAEEEAYIFTPPGFVAAGVPAVAEGERTAELSVTVVDSKSGKPTPCRVNVIGPEGNYYYPADDHLAPFRLTGAWPEGQGNRQSKAPIRYFGRFFYTLGKFSVRVPAGTVRVEVWKGFEYRPVTYTVRLDAGAAKTVKLPIERTTPMAPEGYYAGDPHLHFPRGGDANDALIFDLMQAEDVPYAPILCYNGDTNAYVGQMEQQESPQLLGLGARSIRRRGDYQLVSGQEYRASHYGHLNLFLRPEMVLESATLDPNTWPVFGNVGQETRRRGGYSIHAHGGYAQEIYADLVHGATDGVELLQFGIYRGIGLAGWYRVLNAGFRFPALGASDYPACRKLSDCRTYVYSSERPDIVEWIRGMAAGRSFLTSGPLILLEVEGHRPGDSIRRDGVGPHVVRARVRVRCEVAPVTHVELVVNGVAVDELVVGAEAGRGQWLEIDKQLPLSESSWIAARAYSTSPFDSADAEAHTNPVYVYVDGRAPHDEVAVDWLIEQLDGQIAVHREREIAERERVLEYFEQAKAKLEQIRKAGGLPAPSAN